MPVSDENKTNEDETEAQKEIENDDSLTTKDRHLKIIKSYEVSDKSAEEMASKLVELHGSEVMGLVNKRNDLLVKNKNYKTKLVELEETNKDLNKKVDSLKKEILEYEKKEKQRLTQDQEIDVDAIVDKRMKSLKEESAREISVRDEKIASLQLDLDRQVHLNREQKLDSNIAEVESVLGIYDKAKPDFRYRMKQVFVYDEEESDHVAIDPSTGERIHDPSDPVKPATYHSYADRILRAQAPHLFINVNNPGLSGNTKIDDDINKYFDVSKNRPTVLGMKLKTEAPEKYEALRKRFEKTKK